MYIPPMRTLYRLSFAAVTAGCVCTVVFAQQPPAPGQPAPAPPISGGQAAPSSPGRSTNLGSDPNGNPLRLALKTGHVSNYDEAKVGTYALPDPLKMSDGKPVGDAKTWARRRAEIMQLVRDEDLRAHAGDHAQGQLDGGRNGSESARGRGGAEEGGGHDRNEPGCTEDYGDGDDAGEREEGRRR